MERVCCQDRITNEDALQMGNETGCLVRTIRERKRNWIEHVLIGDGLEGIERCAEGKNVGEKTTR